ncbi:MAG: peptide-methionine (S)-S-oxide reductase MsrA [Rhodocyclaceae bacterium]|nr:peptide-methionine (S)-S-oxide reductase MsrA [Rhodocyclaceae bacterium]MCB1890891.1 peptide-methionine (S)-S-oxide reductase MsrA [Rhodocyclaceae bacterium]MCW5595287.1 peptide-methionine (S)-S-oxide reductase MsrA [Rhodocyclaceae bacterium]
MIAALRTLAWLATALLAAPALSQAPTAPAQTATAIFAGGCFWCVEADFDKLPGVVDTESGYTGGTVANPTYELVSAEVTGHAEAVRVTYDPATLSYERLLDYFWHHIDPTVKNEQFCDTGTAYRSAIFYQDEAQRLAAEASREALQKSGKFSQIHTEITAAGAFWTAEESHQNYYKKNPLRYHLYRSLCGRDDRLKAVWGKNP